MVPLWDKDWVSEDGGRLNDGGLFQHYKVVLVIADIYNRQYLKELVNLLLNPLGFGGCFLVQDHVASTFGAGLGAACVVDLGDQKTSISCVEDALSQRATRVRPFFSIVSLFLELDAPLSSRFCAVSRKPTFFSIIVIWNSSFSFVAVGLVHFPIQHSRLKVITGRYP